MHTPDTASVSALTIVSPTTTNTTSLPLARASSDALFSHHSSSSAVAQKALLETSNPSANRTDLYASQLRRGPAPALSGTSSSSSLDSRIRPTLRPTAAATAAAGIRGTSPVLARSPPSSRLEGAGASSSSQRSFGASASPLHRHHHHNHHHHAEADFSTMVSATTMTMSSTRTVSRLEEEGGEGGGGASRRRGSSGTFAHISEDVSDFNAVPVGLAPLPGPPPPSGLRDPVTLLQLLPVDLLLQSPVPPTPLVNSVTDRKDHWNDGEHRGGTPPGSRARSGVTATALPASGAYRRAFALLRCARTSTSTLHQSPSWRDGGPLHSALGRVMAEVQQRNQAGAASLPPPGFAHVSPSPHAPRTGRRLTARVADESSVLLCSLGNGPESPDHSHHGGGYHQLEGDSSDAPLVPLLFFAATVESPPDIRRCFLLSRTHAYLCDLDGTVAYCAAIRDVRQIVACAGGYMVWRFLQDATVLTLRRENTGEGVRKLADAAVKTTTAAGGVPPTAFSNAAAAGAGGGGSGLGGDGGVNGKLTPASPMGSQRGGVTPHLAASPSPAATSAKEVRDEMSDWVFRILSVGDPTSMPAAATVAGVSPSMPNAPADGGDLNIPLSTSLRDEGLAEERLSAMVFLLNVMCTLRTLPRLLIDAMTAGTADGAEGTSLQRQRGTGAYTSPWERPRITHRPAATGAATTAAAAAAVVDQLDRMHVAGDRPSRVPLLLEGAVGHQTAVKFVEQYWTTRYDQLPPLLRPRRLNTASYRSSNSSSNNNNSNSNLGTNANATGSLPASTTAASALEGGRGAYVCFVESSLLLPTIPVLPLEACLAAEDSVAEMLQTTRDAVRATSIATPSSPTSSTVKATEGGGGRRVTGGTATPRVLPLKDLATAAEQEKAKAALSPAAWRVLDHLLSRGGGASGRRGEGGAGGPLWLDDNIPTTTLTTPVTPDTANTRVHSERASSRSSSAAADADDADAAVAAAKVEAVPAVPALSSHASSSYDTAGVAESSLAGDSHGSSCASSGVRRPTVVVPLQSDSSVDQQQQQQEQGQEQGHLDHVAQELEDVPAMSDYSSPTSTVVDDEVKKAMAEGTALPPSISRNEEEEGEEEDKKKEVQESADHSVRDTPPLTLKPATLSRASAHDIGDRSRSSRSSHSGSSRSRDGRGGCADATSGTAPHAKLLNATARAITQARLRRQRRDTDGEGGCGTAVDAVALPITPKREEGEEETMSGPAHVAPVADVVPKRAVVATTASLQPTPMTSTVEAFEGRIRHRPTRDRQLLRARYIAQLLQPPLRSTYGDDGGDGGGHHALRIREGRERSTSGGRFESNTRSAKAEFLADDDADRLLDDLRRQRVIAELMRIQQSEAATEGVVAAPQRQLQRLVGADAVPPQRAPPPPPPPPPPGGIDVRGWRAAVLEERMQRHTHPHSSY